MPAIPADWVVPLVSVVLGLALGIVLWNALHARIRRYRLVSRFTRARRGEAGAHDLLASRGFTVLGAQCSGSYRLNLDGEPLDIGLRADYLVEKDGLRYIAEVKTGNLAPLVRTPSTRRQLLEYRVAFDVDGVLLVDVEGRRVQTVTFPLSTSRDSERASHAGWVFIGVAFIVAIVITQSR